MAAEKMTLNVPWDVLDACNGFSMDMGGSQLKLAYIDKKEWLEPEKREQDSKGKLYMTTFTHAEFNDGTVYNFIKDHVLMKPGKDNEPPPIYGTGFWVSTNGKTINKELGVSIKVIPEGSAFISALTYCIKHLPRGEVVHELPEETIKVTKDLMKMTKDAYKQEADTSKMLKIAKTEDMSLDPYFEEGPSDEPFCKDPDIFPYLIVLCGSGVGSLCVYEDGTYRIVSKSMRAGKTWLGFGSLLTGAEDYETLMKLVENGSNENLDVTYGDFAAPDDYKETKLDSKDDVYQIHDELLESFAETEPMTVFSFGKAVEKTIDDFKKEDLAKTYLLALISDMVSHVGAAAMHENVKHVFFTGGFVNHPLVRRAIFLRLLVSGFTRRYLQENVSPFKCHFVKGGQHYGAIGALLNHKYIRSFNNLPAN